jgi:hypothetical protein
MKSVESMTDEDLKAELARRKKEKAAAKKAKENEDNSDFITNHMNPTIEFRKKLVQLLMAQGFYFDDGDRDLSDNANLEMALQDPFSFFDFDGTVGGVDVSGRIYNISKKRDRNNGDYATFYYSHGCANAYGDVIAIETQFCSTDLSSHNIDSAIELRRLGLQRIAQYNAAVTSLAETIQNFLASA